MLKILQCPPLGLQCHPSATQDVKNALHKIKKKEEEEEALQSIKSYASCEDDLDLPR